MLKYTIKSYQEEFLEAQEQVGKEATKDWIGFGQSPASRLKQTYSQEGFDPETKYYAFKDDKLVGFITATILPEKEGEGKRANLEFPIVLKDHMECSDLLFKQAISSLKKKGVTVVQTRVGNLYKGTQEMAKRYGYTYAQDLYVFLEAKIDDISSEQSQEINVIDYDNTRDYNEWLRIFVEKLGAQENNAKAAMERITANKERYPIHLVIRKDDKMVGRTLALPTNDSNKFNLSTFYYEDDKYFSPLVSEAISKMKAIGVESVGIFLSGQTLPYEEKFTAIGFTQAGKIDYYEKEI